MCLLHTPISNNRHTLAQILAFPTTYLQHTDLTRSTTACKQGRFMSECEYVSKTWRSLCTPWSERLHFLISKLDTLDSWLLTPHFTWVAERPHSPFSGSRGVARVTVDTAVLCYAELWEPPHISTTPSVRKSVSNQMLSDVVCVKCVRGLIFVIVLLLLLLKLTVVHFYVSMCVVVCIDLALPSHFIPNIDCCPLSHIFINTHIICFPM